MSDDLLVRVTVYKKKLVIEGPDAKCTDPDWWPNSHSAIGCMVTNTRKRLGVSAEAVAFMKNVQQHHRTEDYTGDLGWWDNHGVYRFGWLGGRIEYKNEDVEAHVDFSVPDGEYVSIPNDVPQLVKDLVDGNDE